MSHRATSLNYAQQAKQKGGGRRKIRSKNRTCMWERDFKSCSTGTDCWIRNSINECVCYAVIHPVSLWGPVADGILSFAPCLWTLQLSFLMLWVYSTSLNNNLWLWSLSVVLIKNCNGSIDIIFTQILCVCVCVCVRETANGRCCVCTCTT